MKRTEIDFSCNKKTHLTKFVGFRNVMGLDELDNEIGVTNRCDKYAHGRMYFSMGDNSTIRLYCLKERILAGYHDFTVGKEYDDVTWDMFISFLKDAGNRYSKIKAEFSKLKVETIKI